MEKEFNLSEKISKDVRNNCIGIAQYHHYIYIEDVKEFIRLLKEELNAKGNKWIDKIIDKLAGKSLIEEKGE